MSNMTPFEIRLELLKMAKDMLNDEYYGKREQISNDWQTKVESAKCKYDDFIPWCFLSKRFCRILALVKYQFNATNSLNGRSAS